jgi:hypothetical protein
MKKYSAILITSICFVGCDTKVDVHDDKAPGENRTTIVTPPSEKKETNTTIVNPPATEKKTEKNSTTVVTPDSSSRTETKTETKR